MKKISYLLLAFFTLITLNTIVHVLAQNKQKKDFIKVDNHAINQLEIDSIQKLTHSIISRIEKGEYYEFPNEKTANGIIKKIDITHQKQIQKHIKNKFGPYIGLQFESLFKSKTQNPFTNKIYRFKGDFNSKKDIEIRVYLNNKKEIIGLNVMTWQKEYFNY